LIRDETSVVERLTGYLGLSEGEARTYVRALKEGSVEDGEAKSLVARGMLIRSADEKVYLPVHPRLALSNLFRSRSDRGSAEMREKRKLIDKLTLELIPAYEARRGGR
jgi:hypothetical protein